MAIGVVFIVLYLTKIIKNEYIMTFGTALAAMGVLKLLQYKMITKNEETVRRRRIMETDERNLAIINKSKSAAFGWYVIIVCSAVIVLEVMGKREYSNILELSVCALVGLYWICYFIYSRRS